MRVTQLNCAWILALASSSLADTIPFDHILWGEKGYSRDRLVPRQASTPAATTTRVADSTCSNGPLTRSCWANGFSIATDFDEKWPNTGRIVHVRSHSLSPI